MAPTKEATALRAARQEAAMIAAIGRPSVFAPMAPRPIVSPWVERAIARTLPAKELAR